MTYTLKTYKLNLNTNNYEQVNTITCDDDNKAKADLLYMYKDRDSKPGYKKYYFSYTYLRKLYSNRKLLLWRKWNI